MTPMDTLVVAGLAAGGGFVAWHLIHQVRVGYRQWRDRQGRRRP